MGKFLNRSLSWALSIIIHTSLKSRSPTSLHQSFQVTSQSLRGSSELYQGDGAVQRQEGCQSQGLCVGDGCQAHKRDLQCAVRVTVDMNEKKKNLIWGQGEESRGIIFYAVPRDVSERELLYRV